MAWRFHQGDQPIVVPDNIWIAYTPAFKAGIIKEFHSLNKIYMHASTPPSEEFIWSTAAEFFVAGRWGEVVPPDKTNIRITVVCGVLCFVLGAVISYLLLATWHSSMGAWLPNLIRLLMGAVLGAGIVLAFRKN